VRSPWLTVIWLERQWLNTTWLTSSSRPALRYGDNEILKRGLGQRAAGNGGGAARAVRQAARPRSARRGRARDAHRGTIRLGDIVFFDATRKVELPRARGLGLVFQSYALWPHRTVFANVAYGLKACATSHGRHQMRVEKALAQIGLEHLAERFPQQL